MEGLLNFSRHRSREPGKPRPHRFRAPALPCGRTPRSLLPPQRANPQSLWERALGSCRRRVSTNGTLTQSRPPAAGRSVSITKSVSYDEMARILIPASQRLKDRGESRPGWQERDRAPDHLELRSQRPRWHSTRHSHDRSSWRCG